MSPAENTMELPRVKGPRRPRPPWPAVAVALAAAIAVGGLALTFFGDDGQQARVEKLGTSASTTPTTAAPATTAATAPTTAAPPATTTTIAPERLTTASRISLDGIGPVDIGMTVDEASAAAGVTMRILPGPWPGECEYARPSAAGFEALAFMVIKGRIARVDGAGSFKTVSGVGVGSTEADVKRTYGDRIRVEGHPYVPSGHYLVYTPNDPGLQHLSMIFETDGERVTRFRAGLKGAVAQIEGCS